LRLVCRAVLFDLDGVLIDTTPIITEAWTTWADDKGLDARKVLEVAHGRRSVEVIAAVAPDLVAETEARDLEELEEKRAQKIVSIEGAADLLSGLPPESWAVVTSAGRPLALHRMSLAGLPEPKTLVSADEVNEGKPHPEGYLAAADRLGVAPEDCVVIEDAPAGIDAAHAAGMKVIAVLTTFEADDLSDADAVVETLLDVKVGSVKRDDGGTRIELVIAR
jgi:mannitol-1-/sugar-/sorbitol-6-phosphatase